MPQQLERVILAEVPRHHLDPGEHVRPAPWLRLESQHRELQRELAPVVGRYERVDAGDVGVDVGPGLRRQRVPGRSRRTARADRSKESIRRQRGRAEHFRQPALADAALELHLPQTILGVRVAESEERVEPARGEDVCHRVPVADDVHGARDAGYGDRSLELGKRRAKEDVSGRARQQDQDEEDAKARQQTAPHGSNDIR